MDESSKVTIEVDARVAEILRLAADRARQNGETLGDYLRQSLGPDLEVVKLRVSQQEAWDNFVSGMSEWCKRNLPPGYVADDSRESMYD